MPNGNDNTVYTKFSKRTGTVIAHHRMWKAADHLLVVKEVGCAEEYKRFYFSDIQALVIARSSSYLLWALLLPVIAMFISAFMIEANSRAFLGGLLAVILVVWVWHLAKGATCTCWLQTGINKERLHMFNRVREANRFWHRIEPLLAEAQGAFSVEAMEAEGTRGVADPRKAPPPVPPVTQSEAV